MDYSFYSQAVPDIAMSPGHSSADSTNASLNSFEDEFDSISPELPVKLELRYAIEAKRAEKGLEMPIIDDAAHVSRQLTADEEERRRVRRERNKVAASRCRVKRKHHVRTLLKESDELSKSNSYLEAMIESLQNEKISLENVIGTHECMNPMLFSGQHCEGSNVQNRRMHIAVVEKALR